MKWLFAIVAASGFTMAAVAADTEYTLPEPGLIEKARQILQAAPLIDGHNDVPWQYRKRVNNRLADIDLQGDLTQLEQPMQTDNARLRQGAVGAQFWSVYVPAAFRGPDGVYMVVEQIDMAKRIINRYPETFELALTADDIVRIHKAGKIASLLGMEGGHSIGNSLAALRQLYELGARYMTLTHSLNIDWADSGTDDPFVGGLSDFGEEVVREMNRLGMMVDLSHVHSETMHDAIDVSAAPVIFSHSSAYAVTPHPRNVPDDVLERLPKGDGVVMVTFLSNYVNEGFMPYVDQLRAEMDRLTKLNPDNEAAVTAGMAAWRAANPAPPNATVADVADHIDHIRDLIGVDYVGIGGDYDGATFFPENMGDVTAYPVLFAELLRRGYSEEELKKIAGQNLLRVMRKVEDVATRLQKERAPSDATLDELDNPAMNANP